MGGLHAVAMSVQFCILGNTPARLPLMVWSVCDCEGEAKLQDAQSQDSFVSFGTEKVDEERGVIEGGRGETRPYLAVSAWHFTVRV